MYSHHAARLIPLYGSAYDTDRQTDRQRNRYIEGQKNRQTDRHIEGQKNGDL